MAPHTRAFSSQSEFNRAKTADVGTVKTRCSHRKSRNGCTECKRRHIRCDERQPSCANCEVAERTCSFPPSKAGKQKQKQGQQHLPGVTSAPSPGHESRSHRNIGKASNGGLAATVEHVNVASCAPIRSNSASGIGKAQGTPNDGNILPAKCLPGLSNASDAAENAIYMSQHLILLHHAHAVPDFTLPNRSVVDIAIRRAADSPYLLDEILSFTAFHLAYLYPGSAECLRHSAIDLQTRALASFTRLTENIPHDDAATAVPRFLFSSILGRHVLADTLVHHRSNFDIFIDRFVECLNLNRGIRAVIPRARDYPHDSEIQPFLNDVLKAENKIAAPGSECDPLSRFMEDSDLGETSAKACRQAIQLLQFSFDICRGLDEENFPQAVSVFSVGVGGAFVDVLRKHRPEALVILAYYGVLLHRCRSFWAFGNTGALMISAIAKHVGSYWQRALAWPLRVLEVECSPQSMTLAQRDSTEK